MTERQSKRIRLKPDPQGILATPPRLGDLAIKLFGTGAGIELDLPRHPPHEPLALEP